MTITERRLSRAGLILLFLTPLVPFLKHIGLDAVTPIISVTDRLAVLLLLLSVVVLLFKGKLNSSSYLIILVVYVFWLSIKGFGSKNFVPAVWEVELYSHIRFIVFIFLGYNLLIYKDFHRFLVYVIMCGFLLNIISIVLQPNFVRSELGEVRIAYEMQVMLYPALYLIFLLRTSNKYERLIIILAFILFIIEQILFQKRITLVKVSAILMCLAWLGFMYDRRIKKMLKKIVLILLVMIPIFIIGLSSSSTFNNTVALTLSRFVQAGSIRETYETDDRLEIGDIVLEDLASNNDDLLGRGLGGVVYSSRFKSINDKGDRYRRSTEMGFPTVILKGGYLYLLLLGILIFSSLATRKKSFDNLSTVSLWLVVLIWGIFFYIEGYIGARQNFMEIIVAYGMGVLLRLGKMPSSDLNFRLLSN